MYKNALMAAICLCLVLLPAKVFACQAHLGFNPDQLGPIGGAALRLAGLAPPKPVFEIKHPATAKSVLGEESEVTVSYTRPYFSKNVQLTVRGTNNVKLSQEVIPLIDRSGTVTIPYQLMGTGYDLITLTVIGEHKGETVSQVRRIYVRGTPPTDQQNQIAATQ